MLLLISVIFVLLGGLVLFIHLNRSLKTLGRIYLLRVPLLTAVGIVAFCGLAWRGGARSLLGGIFDVGDSWWGVFFVSLTAFFAAWVVMATWRLVRLYGPVRNPDFDDPRPKATFESEDFGYLAMYYILVFVVALPPIFLTLSTSEGSSAQWLAAILGFFVTLLCIVGVIWVQLRFTRKDIAESESPDLFLPTKVSLLKPLFDGARVVNRSAPTADRFTRIFKDWPEDVFRGYFEYGTRGDVRSIRPGHAAASILLVVTLAAYALLGLVKYLRLGEDPLVPTLCYVLLLATLFCWAFSSLAFFLDRYRIPVLLPVAVWLAVTSTLPWSDYFFPVKPLESPNETAALTTGGSTERSGESPPDDSMIVVAVNGGGIQAAAWAAQVLTGLEEACREQCDRQFDEEIRLISSVSGGSVGTMYFVNAYEDGRVRPNTELHGIVDRAEGSSIDEISWGVLYPDLVRTIFSFPIPLGWDRGRALEEAWLRRDIPWDTRAGIEEGLIDWREDAEEGNRPAVIFNTTITESGQRLPLATTELPEGTPGKLNYDQLFAEGERKDIRVVTAARLSASFPYVSPAARAADISGPQSHLVDGGYYDNYGISSLVEWLDARLRSDHDINEVLIIEIRGAPSPPSYAYADAERCPEKPATSAPDRRSRPGWFYQYTAPLQTVLGVRDAGQRAHNELELDLLIDKWDEQDKENERDEQGEQEPDRVDITRALFEFDRHDTPLSWHLSANDKRRIEDNWQEELNERDNACAGWEKVKTFLTEDEHSE